MLRKNIFRQQFIKIFLSYVIAVLLPLLIASTIYLQKSITETKDSILKEYTEDVNYFENMWETMIHKNYNYAFQISSIPGINDMLTGRTDVGIYDTWKIYDSIGKMSSNNRFVFSTYLYNAQNDIVYSTRRGAISANTFYDRVFIDDCFNVTQKITNSSVRTIEEPNMPGGYEVFSTTVKIPLFGNSILGLVVVNLDYHKLVDILYAADRFRDIYVVDNDFNVKFSFDRNRADHQLFEKNGKVISLDELGKRDNILKLLKYDYFLIQKRSEVNDFIIAKYILSEDLFNKLYGQTRLIIIIFISVCIFGFILSMLLSATSFKPIKKIGQKLMNGSPKSLALEKDVYTAIEHTMESLVLDNQSVKDEIKKAKPILREKICQDILWNNFTDSINFNDRMKYVGINFNHPYFIVFVAKIANINDMKDYNKSNHILTLCKTIILQEFNKLFPTYGGITIEEDKLVFFMNTDLEKIDRQFKDKMVNLCQSINKMLHRSLENRVVYSFGNVVHSIYNIFNSFINARKRFLFRLTTNINTVMFTGETNHKDISYPVTIYKKIINGIKLKDIKIIDAVIDELFDNFIDHNNLTSKEIQNTLMLLIMGVINKLVEDGANISVNDINVYEWTMECRNKDELKKKIKEYLEHILELQAEQEQEVMHSDYISNTIVYIKNNYQKEISVYDISKHINLHPVYLTRIFKKATGKTLIEYLTLVRVEKAKEMLINTNMTVKQISKSVGYCDARSFWRFFKKYEGITPGDYRKKFSVPHEDDCCKKTTTSKNETSF